MLKKRTPIILFVICLIMLFPHRIVYAEDLYTDAGVTFVLPLSIQNIEDEAFSGTAAETVILPEGLQSIGNFTFTGHKLRNIYIPPSTESISESAFSKSDDLVIHGVEGSCAHDWAEEHEIPFVEEDIWRFMLDNGTTVSVHETGVDFPCQTINLKRIGRILPRAEEEDESKRPQDRPELNPIDYRFP